MNKLLVCIFIAVSVALVGCKGSQSKGSNVVDKGLGPLTAPVQRNYSASELEIGKRICAAFKHKREFFETLVDMQEKFRFKGETTTCVNQSIHNVAEFNTAISNSSAVDMEYVATVTRPDYFKDVVHDQNGVMTVLCDQLSKSDSVSNTILSGNAYLVVNLLIADGFDKFEVSKRTKDSNGNFHTASAEGIKVITQTSQADAKFFGVEKERIRYTPCKGSDNVSSLKQSWLSAVTSF